LIFWISKGFYRQKKIFTITQEGAKAMKYERKEGFYLQNGFFWTFIVEISLKIVLFAYISWLVGTISFFTLFFCKI